MKQINKYIAVQGTTVIVAKGALITLKLANLLLANGYTRILFK